MFSELMKRSNALADMAQLAGVRFVQSSELGTDTRLAARVMKYLVQGAGSEVKAALKYGNPQRIRETWKAFIDCNELPDLEDPDDTAFLDRVQHRQHARRCVAVATKGNSRALARIEVRCGTA
jgi:hypothetical protein